MSTTAAQVRDYVTNDPVLSKLPAGEQAKLEAAINSYAIPNTRVYVIIVFGVIIALLVSLIVIGWSVIDGSASDAGLTAAIAVASGCFGGLVGALAPQKT